MNIHLGHSWSKVENHTLNRLAGANAVDIHEVVGKQDSLLGRKPPKGKPGNAFN